MPDRASVTQQVQLGVESTPGTLVPANKLMKSWGIGPGASVDMQEFRPVGQKFKTVIVPGKEWTEFDIDGIASYNEAQYLLAGIMNLTGGAPTSDGTLPKKWNYTLSAAAPDTVKTYSFEQGDSNFAHKFAYGLLNEVGFAFSRDGVEVSGSGMGRALQLGATLTASPTALADNPVLPTQVDVYMDSTFAGLGTTKLLRVLSAELTIGDRFNPLWVLNSAASAYDGHVEAEPSVELELLLQADTTGVNLFTDMRAGTTKYIRIAAVGAQIEASKFYEIQFNLVGKVSDVSDFSDEDGVYAVTFTFEATNDGTNPPLSGFVRNVQATL